MSSIAKRSPKQFERIFRLVVLVLGLWLFFDLASHLAAEVLWFQELGYLPVYLLRLENTARTVGDRLFHFIQLSTG